MRRPRSKTTTNSSNVLWIFGESIQSCHFSSYLFRVCECKQYEYFDRYSLLEPILCEKSDTLVRCVSIVWFYYNLSALWTIVWLIEFRQRQIFDFIYCLVSRARQSHSHSVEWADKLCLCVFIDEIIIRILRAVSNYNKRDGKINIYELKKSSMEYKRVCCAFAAREFVFS